MARKKVATFYHGRAWTPRAGGGALPTWDWTLEDAAEYWEIDEDDIEEVYGYFWGLDEDESDEDPFADPQHPDDWGGPWKSAEAAERDFIEIYGDDAETGDYAAELEFQKGGPPLPPLVGYDDDDDDDDDDEGDDGFKIRGVR